MAVVLLVLMIFVAVFGFSFQMLRYQLMEAGSGSRYKGPIPGPEGVSCTLYSVYASGGVRVGGEELTLTEDVGTHSIIGSVNPGDWVAYRDYDAYEYFSYARRIGYRWVRPDPSSPIIQAVIVDRETGDLIEGINLEIRIRRPTVEEINRHGDPIGRDPTSIEWYSYETAPVEDGDRIRWKHYAVWIIPVDMVIELSVRSATDLNHGDFKDLHLWFVLDTVEWINAFTENQKVLLESEPPEGVVISTYNFRGAFPIWAWVGEWDPWVIYGRDGDPEKSYASSDISSGEWSELSHHLEVMPGYEGTEITLYTQPDYIYDRLFASDIIKDPERLREVLEDSISSLPDPRFAQTVYLPITLVNYGALKLSGGWWIWCWEKLFYPTSYLRIRVLYAVYGEWVYLWTRQEAEEQGYDWENRSSIIDYHKSEWEKFWQGISDWWSNIVNSVTEWLTNPLTQFWAILIIAVISLIAFAIISLLCKL